MPYERVPLVRDQGDAQDTPPNAREADSFEARASLVRVSWLLEGASKENLFFMKRPSAWVSCYTSEKLEPTLPLSSPSPNKPDSESPQVGLACLARPDPPQPEHAQEGCRTIT